MKFHTRINNAAALDAFQRAPLVMTRNVALKLWRGALELAADLKRAAPKSLSTLTNAIRAKVISPLHMQVVIGTNYARQVSEGTRPGYMPPPQNLLAWVRRRSGIRKLARRGSPKRASQERELRDRAWGLALHIRRHGTKPNPYVENTLEAKRSRLQQLVDTGVADGIRELGWGGRA